MPGIIKYSSCPIAKDSKKEFSTKNAIFIKQLIQCKATLLICKNPLFTLIEEKAPHGKAIQ